MRRKSTPVTVTIANFRFFAEREGAIGSALDTLIAGIQRRAEDEKCPIGELTRAAEVLLNIQLEVGKHTPPSHDAPTSDKEALLAHVQRARLEANRNPGGAEAHDEPAQIEEAPEEAEAFNHLAARERLDTR